MKIKDLPKIDLPREKLEKYGVKKLSDSELLALLLGSGIQGVNVLELSKKILQVIKKIGINKITKEDLEKVKGLGKIKAGLVIGLIELTKRLGESQKQEVLTPKDIWNLCADIRESKKEHFVAFYIDTQNKLIERRIISIGILNASLVHPREVFEPAIALSAASIIVAHNHPSGSLEPSIEDKSVTLRLKQSADLLGISLSDHIIVSTSGFMSFAQKDLI